MEPLYTAAQTRALDRAAIEGGIPGFQLMARAGRAAFGLLRELWPDARHIYIFCGTGNNGGDGYIVAELCRARGVPVTVCQVGDAAKITGDALQARQRALAAGVAVVPFNPDGDSGGTFDLDSGPDTGSETGSAANPQKGALIDAGVNVQPTGASTLNQEPGAAEGVVVDALLGTGLGGDVRGDAQAAIAQINRSGLPVLALDVPSGLCPDTGRVLGSAVLASHTITFIGIKQGLVTGSGPAWTGALHSTDLAVPPEVHATVPPACHRLELDEQLALLPPRPLDAHKGRFGHALVVGGDWGMAGAAIMAGEAAARCGAGLVSAATRPAHVPAFAARVPEVMAHGVEGGGEMPPLLERPTAIAVGPGLGATPWSEQLLWQVAHSSVPLVLDADALNLLATGRIIDNPRRDNWILTPHPGEAARLLGCDTATVNGDRFAAVRALQGQYGGTVLLKGAGTLIAAGDALFLCPYGNPGMASGGMGDVLSGVLVALLAQGLAPLDAACLGACLHGMAADLAAAEGGAVGLLATDLMPHLRRLLGG